MERWHTYTERSLRLVSSGLSRPWLCSSSCISFSFSLCGPWPLCVDMVALVRRLVTAADGMSELRVIYSPSLLFRNLRVCSMNSIYNELFL